jgi:hypothetical protein
MKPTAIATGVIYMPLMGKIEDQLPAHNNDNYYDHWHVEMLEYGYYGSTKSTYGVFESKEEAQGYMAGWNAHRNKVSEILFVEKCNRKK